MSTVDPDMAASRGSFRNRAQVILCACTLAVSCAGEMVAQEQPLHIRINQIVDHSTLGPRGTTSDDLAFLRRIHLDLTGRIPSAGQARAFLAETAPDKRVREIDRLLASPDYTRHMALVFDIMLMERRGNSHVKTGELRAWLRKAIEDDRPYPEIAAAFIAADGTPEKQRPASAFFLERGGEPNLMTREIGRMFFGIDLQCAQCHDHPNIDDYLQTDYYGLFAFVSRTSVFRPDAKKPALLGESSTGAASFKSVFTDRQAITGPRAPGAVEIVEVTFPPGDEYHSRPAKNVRGIPKFSRREKLAELIAAGGNRDFDRNIANRLWAVMLGRGLVHPVDQHHSDNPPTIPELLDLISTEFAASNYNVRFLLREIAQTGIYQRSFQLPENLTPSVNEAHKTIPELKAVAGKSSELVDVKQAAADALLEQLDAALAEARPIRAELNKAIAAGQAAAKKRNETAAALAAKKTSYTTRQKQSATVSEVAQKARAAASILADDKELAAVATKLEAKVKTLTAETTKLKAAVDAAVKPATSAETALAAAATAINPHREKIAPVETKIRERRTAFISAQQELHRYRETLRSTERRIEFLESLIALNSAEAQLSSLSDALPSATQANIAARQAAETALATLEAARTAMTNAAQLVVSTTSKLNTTQATLAKQQTASQFTSEALVSAQTSLKQLPEDPDITQAVAKLETSAARIAQALAVSQAALPEQTKAAAQAQATARTIRQLVSVRVHEWWVVRARMENGRHWSFFEVIVQAMHAPRLLHR